MNIRLAGAAAAVALAAAIGAPAVHSDTTPAADPVPVAVVDIYFRPFPAVTTHQYPSDCFHRKLSWTLDYATGTCAWVPVGASFEEDITCKLGSRSITVRGVRQWHAYRDSTASCPGGWEMVGAYNSKWAG